MSQEPKSKTIPQFTGEILVCEDNELNQHVIKFHLTRLGFVVAVAGDGREGVDAVRERMKPGGKPFGLILMDMYMPGMGGEEAVEALSALGSRTPVVAITAVTEAVNEQSLLARGFSGLLNKPIVEEELWECLKGYFTPSGSATVDENQRADEEDDRRSRLVNGFLKRNRRTSEDIAAALEAGDIKLAHRLAHTLRGIAGLLEEPELRDAAQAVERSLADGSAEQADIKGLTDALDRELKAVVSRLEPRPGDRKPEGAGEPPFNKEKAAAVFAELRARLEADSAESLDFIGELRKIPGTGGLIERIEDYDFDLALEALAALDGFGGKEN